MNSLINLPTLPAEPVTLQDGQTVTYQSLLGINENDLSGEFARHAAWLGYIGVQTAKAEADYESSKLEADSLYAEKDTTARLAFNTKGMKFTEAMVQSHVMLDDDYLQALRIKVEKLEAYKLMKALETAMKERGSMLVSLGATMRQELDVSTLITRRKE